MFKRTHHVTQADVVVIPELLHQRVVVGGEQRAAANPLRQFLHHCTSDSRAVVSGCASS